MVDPNFPWALRLELEGGASLRIERRGRWFRVDPTRPDAPWAPLGEVPCATPLRDDEVVLLTAAEPERVEATVEARGRGVAPPVLAQPELLAYVGGPGHTPPAEIDGVAVSFLPYAPAPVPRAERLRGWVAAARAPRRLLQRVQQDKLPAAPPVAFQLRFPDGRRLAYLGLALHSQTPAAWVEQAIAAYGGADWLITGVVEGEQAALAQALPRFAGKRVLVADLTGDLRRAAGLPHGLLTPLVDGLVEAGIDAYVFATRSSFRFE